MITRTNSIISDTAGHTLVELLVVMGMLILMASGIGYGFKSVLAYDRSDQARSEALEEAVRATEWITRNIADATSINVSSNMHDIKVSLPPNTSIGKWTDVSFLQYQVTNSVLQQTIGIGTETTYTSQLIQPQRNPQYSYSARSLELYAVTNIGPEQTTTQRKLRKVEIHMDVQFADKPAETITTAQWVLLHNINE